MVRVKGSWTNQSCPGDEYLPFEPSSSHLGHSKVAQRKRGGSCTDLFVLAQSCWVDTAVCTAQQCARVHTLFHARTAPCTHCSVRAHFCSCCQDSYCSQPISAFFPAAKHLHSANFCPFCQEHSCCSQPSSALLPSTCTQPTSALSAMSAAATASLHLPILPCCHRPKTILAFLVASVILKAGLIGHKPSPIHAEHFGISHVMIGCTVSEIARDDHFCPNAL